MEKIFQAFPLCSKRMKENGLHAQIKTQVFQIRILLVSIKLFSPDTAHDEQKIVCAKYVNGAEEFDASTIKIFLVWVS